MQSKILTIQLNYTLERNFSLFFFPRSRPAEMWPKKASSRHQLWACSWSECPVGTWNCPRVFPCPCRNNSSMGFLLQSMSLIIYGTILADCRIRMYNRINHYFHQNICIDTTSGSLDALPLALKKIKRCHLTFQ